MGSPRLHLRTWLGAGTLLLWFGVHGCDIEGPRGSEPPQRGLNPQPLPPGQHGSVGNGSASPTAGPGGSSGGAGIGTSGGTSASPGGGASTGAQFASTSDGGVPLPPLVGGGSGGANGGTA